MKKTLYSLMLNEEVVRQVDALAHRLGTNRSALINQILAEYVNYTTPERRISDILSEIQRLMTTSMELVPVLSQGAMSMSLKSSLDFKYRPTLRYEVELFGSREGSIGALSVLFRTTAPVLISGMTAFFRLWTRIEAAHLPAAQEYELYDGRFTRSIQRPDRDCTAEELADAISGYITLFDRLMKDYLAGRLDERGAEAAYYAYMTRAALVI